MLGSHSMVGWMINEFGNDEQRQEWLPNVAEGKMRFGIGITEADGGSDVAALRTSARREGQDYIINGSKMFITNSENATHFAIMVRTNPKAEKPTRGISCILMDRNLPGFSASRHLDKMGYKGLRTGELVFDDCPVPTSCLIGEENRGFHQLMAALGNWGAFRWLLGLWGFMPLVLRIRSNTRSRERAWASPSSSIRLSR